VLLDHENRTLARASMPALGLGRSARPAPRTVVFEGVVDHAASLVILI
jgi:hypothetical protein